MTQDPFLKKVAIELYNTHGADIRDIRVIVPSHRAGLYFKYFLAEHAQENLIAPEVMAMDEFAQRLSGLQLLDKVTLLFELFRSFRTFDPKSTQNLERFAPLGMVMLKDFNMIDMNLTEKRADQLFEYVDEVKALERWAEELGDGEREIDPSDRLKGYFSFWKNMRSAYWHFREKLLQNKQAYNGLAFRHCWNHLDELFEKSGWGKVVFAGFNQLTKIEEQLMERLSKEGRATTYWDVDNYYYKNPQHEAGDYIRSFKKWLPSDFSYQQDELREKPPRIRMVYAGDAVSHAKVAGELLKRDMQTLEGNQQLSEFQESINRIGILLPDESLLNPLLHSFPEFSFEGEPVRLADYVNITMGLSFKYTPLYTLIYAIFKMQENARERNGKVMFWHKDVLKIMQHPFLLAWEGAREQVWSVAHAINDDKRVLIELDWLRQESKGHIAFQTIFSYWEEETPKAIDYFFQLVEALSKALDKKQFSLEQEFLFQFYTLMKRLNDVMVKFGEQLTFRTFKHFLFELLRSVSVPFTGEPISPIQVMGTLESRALDFSHVYILSCNEGVFPQGKLLDSLIPFDLRREYKLPTHKENDASFSFTFHRLLHRAESVTLLYSSPTDALGGGEKSRFLTQIEKESGWPIEHLQLEMDLPEVDNDERAVKKDAIVVQQIKQALKKGHSPTAINQYIKNPLEFYFSQVLKLGEYNDLEDTVDFSQFGTLVHETLENLLKPKIGATVTAEHLLALKKDQPLLESFMKEAIEKEMGNVVMDSGKNYILYQVALELIQQFLALQAESFAPFYLVDQEHYHDSTFTCTLPSGEQVPVRFSGKADRIDIDPVNKVIRVVDYKTGTYNFTKDLKANTLEELLLKQDKGKMVQLLLYKYFLINYLKLGKVENLPIGFDLKDYKIQSGFYFFRKLTDGYIEYDLKDEPQDIDDFCKYTERFLQLFVQDLLDVSKPFSENPSDFGLVL